MMKIRSLGLALALGFVLPASQAAIPFVDQQLKFRQPDGNTLTIYLSGNNYFAEQRLADGKLVVYDNQLKGYAYAQVSHDGTVLQSTGRLAVAPAGNKLTRAGSLQSLQPQQGLSASAKAALVTQAQQQLFGDTAAPAHDTHGLTDASARAESAAVGTLALPPTVRGLTVIIQFPDQAGTISKTQVESFLNDLTYTGFGNAQSVRGYFRQVSGNKLDYQNTRDPLLHREEKQKLLCR